MVTIRQMEIPDLDQVLPIEEANFSTPWTANGFFTFLIREDALFLTAEEDGEILGYCGIILSLDEGEITNVCVREDCRKRGIGQMLMEGLIRETKKAGVRVWHLEVRQSNESAIRLYEKLGFVQDGLRKGYYEAPKEDAVLMSRKEDCKGCRCADRHTGPGCYPFPAFPFVPALKAGKSVIQFERQQKVCCE